MKNSVKICLGDCLSKLKRFCFVFLVVMLGAILICAGNGYAAEVDVNWTDLVGVSVDGSTLTKTASSSWGNGGAASTQSIAGDGKVSFKAGETTTHKVCGLSSANVNANYTMINYGIYPNSSGAVYVYENGTSRGNYGSYTVNDVFTIERVGTTILYKKNDVTFYTSAASSSGNLIVDTAIYSNGGSFTEVTIDTTGTGPSAPDAVIDLAASKGDGQVDLTWTTPSDNGSVITGYELQYGTVASGAFGSTFTDDAVPGATVTGLTNDVEYQFRVVAINAIGTSGPSNVVQEMPEEVLLGVWTDLVGVSTSGNTVTKTASTAWGNGGAASTQSISGNGKVTFKAGETTTHKVCGLSSTNANANYTTINYGIYPNNSGTVYVYENGTSRGNYGSYTVNDVFAIERVGTTILYKKNDVTFYTSAASSSGNLIVDTAIYSNGGSFTEVIIDTTGTGPSAPDAVIDLAASEGDGQVDLTWTTPSNNGSAITGYEVQYGAVASGAFGSTLTDDVVPGATVTGLTNDVEYQFRVVAINAIGISGPSNVVLEMPEEVLLGVWTDLVGVSVNGSGSAITKTASTAWGNGGAASTQSIAGDGKVSFKAGETTTHKVCGLSSTNANANYRNINYGIYPNNSGTVYVYENGTSRGNYGSYTVNDVFTVERVGTTILYKKNDVTFYTSTVSSSGDLIVDVGIYSNGGSFTEVTIDTTGTGPSAPDAVIDLAASKGDGQVDLTWTTPSDNGSVITGYEVQYGTVASGAFGSTLTDDVVPGATITGLTNGTEYQFRVVAINAIGISGSSNVVQEMPEEVVVEFWTDLVGVSTSGNTVTKTASTAWGNGGAASTQSIAEDGKVEFKAGETTTHKVCGLSSTNANANYTTINYGIYPNNSGTVYVYENGTSRGNYGSYTVNDVFAVERAGTIILYKKNDVTFYTSTVPSSGDLIVDVGIYSNGGSFTDVTIDTTGTVPSAPGAVTDLSAIAADGEVSLAWSEPANNGSAITGYEVQYGAVASGAFASTLTDDVVSGATITGLTNGTEYQFRVVAINAIGTSVPSNVVQETPEEVVVGFWTDLVGVSTSGNTVTKTASTSWGNGGAASTQSIAEDGKVEFKAGETTTHKVCGLSSTNANANYTTINYGIYPNNSGTVYVYENGTSRGNYGSYTVNDVFAVERVGTTILYKKNDVTFYTSTASSSGDLIVDVGIYSNGGSFTDVTIDTTGTVPSAPGEVTDLSAIAADGEVSLAWSEPANNGSAITGYEVQYGTVASGAFASTLTDDAVPGATVLGLTNGTEYQFRVVATNGIGTSGPSNVVLEMPEEVSVEFWTDLVGVSTSGNTVTKTASTAWGNGGAASTQNIAGDGKVTFKSGETTTHKVCGLSSANANANYTTINYGIYPNSSGTVYVYENGTSRGNYGSYTIDDVFAIERVGTTILYKKNDVTFYTSTVSSSGDLIVDVGIYSNGGSFTEVIIDTTGTGPSAPDAVIDLAASQGDGQVDLTWTSPSDNGSAITGYEVQYGTVASGAFASTLTDDAVPGATVTGLTNDVEYQFRVVAINAIGTSGLSNIIQSTPIAAINLPPVAQDQLLDLIQNTSIDITLEATDPNDDSMTYLIIDPPNSGTLSGAAPNITYFPNTGFLGTDSFTFVANDGEEDSNIATVNISVVSSTEFPEEKTVTFQGSGSGVWEYIDPSGWWQRIEYTMAVDFTVYGENPTITGDRVTYELVRKVGTVSFSGTARHYNQGETTTLEFSAGQNIDYVGSRGTFDYSTIDCGDININFPTQLVSASLPYLTHINYSGSNSVVRGTFYMESPWRTSVTTLDYSFDVPATDDFDWPCIINLDFEKTTFIPGDTSSVFAHTLVDSEDTLEWQVIPMDNSSATAVITPTNELGKTASLTDIEGEGLLLVKVINPSIDSCEKDMLIYVGCDSCGSSSGKFCALDASNRLSSIDVSFGLGRTIRGKSVGNIYLRADTPSPLNSTPEILEIYTFSDELDKLYDGGVLRQVIAHEVFVDIVVNDEFNYVISFYDIEDKGMMFDGFYLVEGAATPIASWLVENPEYSPSEFNRLRITETKDSFVKETEYFWDEFSEIWSLDQANGLQVQTLEEEILADTRIVSETIKDGDDNIASEKQTTYQSLLVNYETVEKIVESVDDPNGDALTTTTTWYVDPCDALTCGKIESQINPDGSWVKYEYDNLGRKTVEISSYLDMPITALESSVRARYYDYTPQTIDDSDLPEDIRKPRKVVEALQGNTVATTYYVYTQETDGSRVNIVERTQDPTALYGDAQNLRTVTVTYPYVFGSVQSWRTSYVIYPDGRRDRYSYDYGTYTPNINPDQPGTFVVGNGSDELTSIVYGTTTNPNGIINKTTAKRRVTNSVGEVLAEWNYVNNAELSYSQVSWVVYQYDNLGHVIETNYSDGRTKESVWGCCDEKSDTDDSGVVKDYTFDELNRIETETKQTEGEDVSTTYTYDAVGRRLTSVTSAGVLSLATTNTYDSAGRLETSTDEAGLVTNYDYSSNGLITTVTRPGGATEITESYIDGQIKSVTGSGVTPQYYTYGVNVDGTKWTQVNIGSEASVMWEKTTVDSLGRTIKVEKPGFNGVEETTNEYNEIGQLVRTASVSQADVLYEYDDLGVQIRTGLDVDGNGRLDFSSTDRITENETSYRLIGEDWWQETIHRVYADEYDSTSTTTSTQLSRLEGLGVGGLVQESITADIHGNETVSRTFIDRDTKTKTQVVEYPDSDIEAESITVNGLLISSQSKSGNITTYGYDALERQIGVTDPRKGTATTSYNVTTGQVDYVEDAARNRTSFEYDSLSGQKIAETNALTQTTRFQYNEKGQIRRTWGDVPYPVQYEYDNYGRLFEMHTWQTGTSWNDILWPTSEEGQQNVTVWNYDEASGLLINKRDAAGEVVSYTYAPGGKLETRTWARDGGTIDTTYSYDSATGELVNIDYSDTTPDVTFTYDRLGRQESVVDGAGTRNFGYNSSLQLETETISGLINETITRTYDASDVLGRATGFNIGSDYSVVYDYDNSGRLNKIDWSLNGALPEVVEYFYESNSDLISRIYSYPRDTVYTYESNRDLKTQVQNNFYSGTISQYDYEYDQIGRRKSVANSGSAFSEAAFNIYDYNDRNELAESNRYIGASLLDTSTPVVGEYRDYLYDNIGNRINITDAANTASYVTNNINQYTTESIFAGGSQTFEYDEDGNLTKSTGNKDIEYVYDAENRLVLVEPTTPELNDRKVEFVYDYQGRRVQSNISTWGGLSWETEKTKSFIYDGWNPIIEETDAGTIVDTQYYIWGLDLSQSLQGSGGVGGLIVAAPNMSQYYHYMMDGNGNVVQLVDVSDGSIDAHYEYDPYGKTILSTGTVLKDVNPYRFSTKYFDAETWLYYYGHRYYVPELGRWLSRDPIEEDGGINLYGFVGNDPVDQIDLLGQKIKLIGLEEEQDQLFEWLNLLSGGGLSKDCAGNVSCNGSTDAWIQKIINDDRIINISFGEALGGKFDFYGVTISHGMKDPDQKHYSYPTNNHHSYHKGASLMGHELQHAYDYLFNGGPTRKGDDYDYWQGRAIKRANDIRSKYTGQPLRIVD